MNTHTSPNKANVSASAAWKFFSMLLIVGSFFLISMFLLWASQTTSGGHVLNTVKSLFAMDSVQSWWYVTRAAGLTSYFLLWLSVIWGLAIPSKFFQSFLEGTFSYDFHEFLSLLGLGFVALHVIVLLFDKYLPFSLLQILIPFLDSYRPFWVGLGALGFYALLLVTVTFYLRKIIGNQAFRSIHTVSLLGYLFATLHGFFAGTDSALPFTQILYAVSFLIVVFLTVYWIVVGELTRREIAAARLLHAKEKARLGRERRRLAEKM